MFRPRFKPAIYVEFLHTRRTQIPNHSQNCRGSNPAVDRGCVYSLPPAGVECVPSTDKVHLVAVWVRVLTLANLIEWFSVVLQ
jgi:hypothetical protein